METLQQFDLRFFYFVNQTMANDVFDILCPIIRERTFMATCYLVFAAIMYRAFPRYFLKIAAVGALTFLLTDQISASLIKPMVHRIRPCNDPLVLNRLIIEQCGNGFSFVSSHATNSFGMATFLSMVRRKRRTAIILVIWASLVCFSQVYVGVHYPGDVIAGGILGATIGLVSGVLYTKFISPSRINA